MSRRESGVAGQVAYDLAALLGSGLPLDEALSRVSERSEEPFQSHLLTLAEQVKAGGTMGEALTRESGPFPPVFGSLVQIAEEGQDLPGALDRLADILDETEEHWAAVRVVASYPLFLGAALIVLFFFLLLVTGKALGALYTQLGLTVPEANVALLNLANIAMNPLSWLLAAGLLGLSYEVLLGRSRLSLFRYRIPFLGAWLGAHHACLFLRWTEFLMKTGLTLSEALRVAAGVFSEPLREDWLKVRQKVVEGDSLAEALKNAPAFPVLALWLVEQQECREQLDLTSVVDLLQHQLSTTRSRGLAFVEPAVVMCVGTLLLVFFAAFFHPLYEMTSSL